MAESKQPKIIIQESKSNELIPEEDQFPDEIVGSCQWPVETGNRKGQACGKKTFDGKDLCFTHEVMESRRKEKEEKQKGKVHSSIERSDVPLIPLFKSPQQQPEPRPSQTPQLYPQFSFPPQQPNMYQQYNTPQEDKNPFTHNTRRRAVNPFMLNRYGEEEESLLSFSEMYKLLELFSNTMLQLSRDRNDNNFE